MRPFLPSLAVAAATLVLFSGCFGVPGGRSASTGPVAASFTYEPEEPRVGQTVRFTDQSTGAIDSRLWDFGDGSLSNEGSPSHVFRAAGVFTVGLTVRGEHGAEDMAERFVGVATLNGSVPTFSVDFDYVVKGLSVGFDPILSPASTKVESYFWDFGDETISRERAPAHVYPSAGMYSVILRVVANATVEQAEKKVPVAVAGSSDALSSRPFAVIAVVDTGINPYHEEFRDARFQDHPSTYIDGYPAAAEALRLTFSASHYGMAVERDASVWDDAKGGQLYWIPGTRIIGAISRDPTGSTPILDEDSHGTLTTSIAAGSTMGSCPSCLIVAVEGLGYESVRWAIDQPWIDIVSNSWNYCVPTCEVNTGPTAGITPVNVDAMREAVEDGLTILFSSGNGVLNMFDVPQLTYWNSNTGPDFIVVVGAADAASGAAVVGTGRPVDVISYGYDWEGASYQSLSSGARCDGTSCAAPLVAGAFGRVLEAARGALGDTTEGPRGGGIIAEIASGTEAPSAGPLSDGRLTQNELERAIFLTARIPNGIGPVLPTTAPGSPAFFLLAGYGLVDADTAERASQVVLGNTTAPVRTAEDAWAAVDSAIRNTLWGPLGASATTHALPPPTPAELDTWEELVAYFEANAGPEASSERDGSEPSAS